MTTATARRPSTRATLAADLRRLNAANAKRLERERDLAKQRSVDVILARWARRHPAAKVHPLLGVVRFRAGRRAKPDRFSKPDSRPRGSSRMTRCSPVDTSSMV